jgi:hypothetical protein
MKRRDFIKKGSLLAGGMAGFPYLLPSGIINAQTSPPMAEHVVFVLFAGGVRQQEAVLQRYLADSQPNEVNKIEGNILYNLLKGEAPRDKIAYGIDDIPNQIVGATPINPILSQPLDQIGTLFPEVRFSKGGAGHFNGLSTGFTGNYFVSQGLKKRPPSPTIFEYLRRYAGFKSSDCWYVGLDIGGSRPLLNYSDHPAFGRNYGGNFIAPLTTFGRVGKKYFQDFKNYHPEEEMTSIREIRNFLNQNYAVKGLEIPHLNPTEEEDYLIKKFVEDTFVKVENNSIIMPPVSDNSDLQTMGYTVEVLRYFKPKITVVDMATIDVCHGSFTDYLKNLHRADHAVGFLWREIQNIPGMANNTTLIVMPEHGRDEDPNSIQDINDWYAYDHSGNNENVRRIFTLMCGPGVEAGLRVGSEGNPRGDAADIVPTIADIFGIRQQVENAGLLDPNAQSLFRRI